MPQLIAVPGEGEVEFPDDMDDDAIAGALRSHFTATSDPSPPQLRAPKTIVGELAKGNIMDATSMAGEEVRRAFSGVIGPSEKERSEKSIPFGTNPDGSIKYEYKPLGDRMEREAGLMTPFLKVEPMAHDAADSPAVATGKAVFNTAAGLQGAILSPLGVLLPGTAQTKGLATTGKVVGGAFGVDMLSHVPEQVEQARHGATTGARIEGALGATVGVLAGGLGVAHAAGVKLPGAKAEPIAREIPGGPIEGDAQPVPDVIRVGETPEPLPTESAPAAEASTTGGVTPKEPVPAEAPIATEAPDITATLSSIATGEPVALFHGSPNAELTELSANSSLTTSRQLAEKFATAKGKVYETAAAIPEGSPVRESAQALLEDIQSGKITETEAAKQWASRPNDIRLSESASVKGHPAEAPAAEPVPSSRVDYNKAAQDYNAKGYASSELSNDPAFWQAVEKLNTPTAAPAPAKPIATLHDAPRVKVTTPKGSTMLRVTDSKGRVILEPLTNVNKGANPFSGAGPFKKIEAGIIGSKKEFVPVKGEVAVANAAQESLPSHLRTDPELARVLSGEAVPEGTKMRAPGKPEGGAIFGAGGTRTPSPSAVGSTPLGSKTWIRLPSLAKRLVGGLEREGAADVMARQQNPTGKLLGRMIKKHVDTEQEIYGQNINILNKAMSGIPKSRAKAAFTEVEAYLRAKENARPIPTVSADASKLLKAWGDLAESTGNLARAHGVQVFDPKTGGYRPMGNLGRDYVPRMFNREVERVLTDPQKDPVLFNNLAQAIATHRGVPLDAAANELRGVASRFQGNDFMGNIEMARGEQLPEIFYEYDLRNLAGRYLPNFSERMGQIISYGQRLGTRESPSRPNLWDVARKESEDSGTQEWLRHAEDQAVNLRQRNAFVNGAIRAQTLGNALLLSDPTGTVMRNLTTGMVGTGEVFGARRSLAKVVDAARVQSRMDAKEIGSVRDNIADFLHADQLGHSFVDDAIRSITDKALTWSGYQGSEVFVRTHNGLVASQFAIDAAKELSSGASKPSGAAKEALAMFKRWEIDPEKIKAEGGDWKTGPETRKFIRTAIREMQGGYRFDQVPLWANSTVGRFFYQYGRWGVQRARNLANNVIKPLIGEEFDWHGKKMVRRDVKPLLRTALGAVVLGETFAVVASTLFDKDRKDASLTEIASTMGEDAKLAAGLALERGLNDIIMAGTLGIWGQPVDFFKGIKDQSRLKNPAEPPSLAGVKAVIDLGQAALEQGGKLTTSDLLQFSGQIARGPTNLAKIARNIFDEPLYEAQNDVATLRSAARRWARDSGLDTGSRKKGDFGKSPNAPSYEPVQEALLVGDAQEAKRLSSEFIGSQDDAKKARIAMRASVKSRQPFRAGPYTAETHKRNFMSWAKSHLSKDDFNQASRIQERYVKAARAADLWSEGD